MSNETTAEEASANLADLITTAIKGMKPAAPAAQAPAAAAPAAKSEAEIATAERERIFAITESDAGKKRPKLAVALAKAGMSAEAANGILAASAEETAAPAAAAAPAAPAAPGGKDDLAAEFAKRAGAAAAGVKPDAAVAKSRPSFVEYAEATAKKR